MNPDIKAALEREAYFNTLAAMIIDWQSDPKAYDLRMVAHEIQKSTGQQGLDNLGRLMPGDFIALLGRCKRRGANPPEPVPPVSAIQMRQSLLEEEHLLLSPQPLFKLPGAYRRLPPYEWETLEPSEPGGATARTVVFDYPGAPLHEIMRIVAETGIVAGSKGKRVWYRLYFTVNRFPEVDVQILAEGATGAEGTARMRIGTVLNAFLWEQCDAPPPSAPEKDVEPGRTWHYVEVAVLLSDRDVKELNSKHNRAEMSLVVTRALQRYARERRKTRAERAEAKRARQAARAQQADTPSR
jgi:hypothetical protein